MSAAFEILRIEGEGKVMWLETAPSLQDATNRVREMASQDTRGYIILNATTGEKHMIAPNGASFDGHTRAAASNNGSIRGSMPNSRHEPANEPKTVRFPQWEPAYHQALQGELELQLKVNDAEAAIFERMQELSASNNGDAAPERAAIQDALAVLLVIKTEKLKYPGLA